MGVVSFFFFFTFWQHYNNKYLNSPRACLLPSLCVHWSSPLFILFLVEGLLHHPDTPWDLQRREDVTSLPSSTNASGLLQYLSGPPRPRKGRGKDWKLGGLVDRTRRVQVTATSCQKCQFWWVILGLQEQRQWWLRTWPKRISLQLRKMYIKLINPCHPLNHLVCHCGL